MKTVTAEIHLTEQMEALLVEAFALACQLEENQKYLNEPWFTKEYQLSLALNGLASSSSGRPLTATWAEEALIDHVNDMKQLLER